MTRSVPWLLFIVSLCFNLFFAAGYMQSQSQKRLAPTTPDQIVPPSDGTNENPDGAEDNRVRRNADGTRIERGPRGDRPNRRPDGRPGKSRDFVAALSHRLSLTDEQKTLFESLSESTDAEQRTIETVIQFHQSVLESLLLEGTVDQDEMQSHVVEIAELRTELASTRMDAMKTFMDALTDEQREIVASAMERHKRFQESRESRKDMIRQFDVDGDGKLDDDERASIRDVMIKHRNERRSGRGRPRPGRDAGPQSGPAHDSADQPAPANDGPR